MYYYVNIQIKLMNFIYVIFVYVYLCGHMIMYDTVHLNPQSEQLILDFP